MLSGSLIDDNCTIQRRQIDAIKADILTLLFVTISSVSITFFPKRKKKRPDATVNYLTGENALDISESLDNILVSGNKQIILLALLELLSRPDGDDVLQALQARTSDFHAENIVDQAVSLKREYKQYALTRDFTFEVNNILMELRLMKNSLKHSRIRKLFDIANNDAKQDFLRDAMRILKHILKSGAQIDHISDGVMMISDIIEQHSRYITAINTANKFFKSTPGETDAALRSTVSALEAILRTNNAVKDKYVIGHFLTF